MMIEIQLSTAVIIGLLSLMVGLMIGVTAVSRNNRR